MQEVGVTSCIFLVLVVQLGYYVLRVTSMNDLFKRAAALYGKIIIINLMSFFVVLSFGVMVTATCTKEVGYKAYATVEGSDETVEYTYYYADGTDTKKAELEGKGYTVNQTTLRSNVSEGGKKINTALNIFFCTAILIVFVYPPLWHYGTKDSNLVAFNHKKKDLSTGLKVGLLASIPGAVFLAVLLFFKNMPIVFYKFLNSGVYGFLELIIGKSVTFGELGIPNIILLFALKLLVPIVAYLSYIMGYKNISISERLVYKKEK